MKLIRPKRIRIFNYATFQSALLLETKALEIEFKVTHFDFDVLTELTEIFTWCQEHTEVKSIYLTSVQEFFLLGKEWETQEIESHYTNFQSQFKKMAELIRSLPQTVLVNMKNGCNNEGLTMALLADGRFYHPQSAMPLTFNFLTKGLLDTTLLQFCPHPFLRSLLLTGLPLTVEQLNGMGFLTLTNEEPHTILKNINAQSNLGRYFIKKENSQLSTSDEVLTFLISKKDYLKDDDFFNLREIDSINLREKTDPLEI